MPFELAFRGDRFGRMRDPFGVTWTLSEPAKAGLALQTACRNAGGVSHLENER
jgi:hypothetical protein